VFRLRYYSALGPEFLPAGEVEFYSYNQPLYEDRKTFSRYAFQTFVVRAVGNSNIRANSWIRGGLEFMSSSFYGDAFTLLEEDQRTFNFLNLMAHHHWNTFRNEHFATKGHKIESKITISQSLGENLGALPNIFYKVEFSQGFEPTKALGLKYNINSNMTLNGMMRGPNTVFAGGWGNYYPFNINRFFGYRRMELIANGGIHSVAFEADFNIFGSSYIKFIGNAGVISDVVEGDRLAFSSQYIDGFGGGYALQTPLGPMQILAAKSTIEGAWQLYLYLGLWF
jgi:NTE family protein